MHPDIVDHQNRLQDLFDEVKKLENTDAAGKNLAVHLTQYLCIRTSGYIENSVQIILLEYVQSQTKDLPTQNYVRASLKMITARYSDIVGTVRRFNENWRTELRNNDIQRFKPFLNNLAKSRNEIAHGRDSKIGLNELEGYFLQAQNMINLLYVTCILQTAISARQ